MKCNKILKYFHFNCFNVFVVQEETLANSQATEVCLNRPWQMLSGRATILLSLSTSLSHQPRPTLQLLIAV